MTAVKLTGNFLATARCLIFSDGGGVSWNFNPNTNTLTASATSGGTFLSSVGLADASTAPIYTITNSPLTANGTLDITLNAQVQKTVFAGPTSGANAQPAFRALAAADIPTIPASGVSGLAAVATTGAYSSLSGTPTIPTGANPSVSVTLATQNGIATTFMRSDAAPALDVTIAPTWTGAHTFSASRTFIKGDSTLLEFDNSASGQVAQIGTVKAWLGSGSNVTDFAVGAIKNINFYTNGSGTAAVSISTAAAMTVRGALAVNGNAAPAQVTGWGTPTGQTVVNNFAAGTTPSLLQMSEAVAQIITDLKAFGIYGA